MARREDMLYVHDSQNDRMTDLLKRWQDGAIKQAVIARCLRLRQQHADVFLGGAYEAVEAQGVGSAHVCAFTRNFGTKSVLVVVSRWGYQAICDGAMPELPHIPPSFWKNTRLMLAPAARGRVWHDTLSGQTHGPVDRTLPLATVLSDLPVSVLFST